jgi:hypothetical protein
MIVGICALFMITVGGYMYITSAGNNATMGKAKSIITDAIIGLVLALLAYLIFYTINPNLTSPAGLQPIASVGTIPAGGGTGKTTIDPLFKNNNIAVTATAGGSTDTVALPDSAKNRVVAINNSIPIKVSGAAETAGHTSHGSGIDATDIQPVDGNYDKLGAYLIQNQSSLGIKKLCTTPQYSKYRINCTTDETANHFHIGG